MHPVARIQSTIEILDNLLTQWGEGRALPADQALAHYTRSRRFIGSKDRRAMADLFYAVIRAQGLVRWWLDALGQPNTARNQMLWLLQTRGELAEMSGFFGGNEYAPAALTADEQAWLAQAKIDTRVPSAAAKANVPEWLYAEFAASFGADVDAELAALQQPADPILRVNTLKVSRDKMLADLKRDGVQAEATAHSPIGIRLLERTNLDQLHAYQQGKVELQDESSQLACLSLGVKPGADVIDLCAGAGGKSLALAALMKDQGVVLAMDVDGDRMQDIAPRAKRAGASIIMAHQLNAEDDAFPEELLGQADYVFLDAPCSGLGTLRRHPDLAWRTSTEQIAMLQRMQTALLQRALTLLKPGGTLLYATCSVLKQENEAVVNQILNEKLTLKLASAPSLWNNLSQSNEDPRRVGLTLTPYRHKTDGFFMAILENTAAR